MRRKAKINNILIFIDEPQLLTVSASRNTSWLGVAVEKIEGMSEPFFCVRVTKNSLQKYFDGKVDLWGIFKYPSQNGKDMREYMAFDFSEISNDGHFYLNPVSIKEDYFPSKGIFSKHHTEEIDLSLEGLQSQSDNDDEYTVNIDGSWDLAEFSFFGNKVSSVYSFLHCIRTLEHANDDVRAKAIENLRETFTNHSLEGGFSYVNFYRDLQYNVPANDRLEVKEIKYASPGHIKICGQGAAFDDLADSIRDMCDNYYLARDSYTSLIKIMKSHNILDSKADLKGSLALQGELSKYTKELCENISLNGLEDIYKSSDNNWIITAKIIMSFYRRIRDLTEFYREGRAKL
ncbi:MAG: hypothetical protein ABF976_04360 [Acetobacter syzygii]|uniref:hypothetical protein n=1 Tax=Acetobacter syzygii TaxID=146476 RepID=UPI0039E91DE5